MNSSWSSCSAVSRSAGRRAARDAVRRQRDERRGRRDLAGQHLLEVLRFDAAHAGSLHVRIGERRLEISAGGASERRPCVSSVKSTWSFLKSVGFSQASTPFANRHDGDAEVGDFATRFDGAGVGLSAISTPVAAASLQAVTASPFGRRPARLSARPRSEPVTSGLLRRRRRAPSRCRRRAAVSRHLGFPRR